MKTKIYFDVVKKGENLKYFMKFDLWRKDKKVIGKHAALCRKVVVI